MSHLDITFEPLRWQTGTDLMFLFNRYVSCIFEDPYEGPTDPAKVLHCVRALLDMGCYEVSLGDTTGVGTPDKVASLIEYLTTPPTHSPSTDKVPTPVPVQRLAGHFHDTYGRGKANVLQAYLCGIRVFDSSVAGLGGCPYAPARGNVATEEIVALFHRLGVETGVNLQRIRAVGEWISETLNRLESGHDPARP